MSTPLKSFCAALAFGLLGSLPSHAEVTFNWAAVGDIGNPADPLNEAGDPELNIPGLGIPGIGSVAYPYEIATTEVTLAQYAEFLNAVDPTGENSRGLYNESMGELVYTFTGIALIPGNQPGSKYEVIAGETRPVTFVSWNDAARFVNWLHNGQGNGTTESGVYDMIQYDMNQVAPVRSAAATYFLPSLNEWYKAAYYQPAASGGDTDNYWLFPTRSNAIAGNTVGESNSANFYDGDYIIDQPGQTSYLSEAGAYGADSASYYGTYDQAGNVLEWNEFSYAEQTARGLSGGAWSYYGTSEMESGDLITFDPTTEADNLGFRVARAADPFAAWGSENLLGYAIGGAPSPGEAGEAPVVDVASSALRLTAVVRKGDPRLVVAGEAVDSLTGTWSSDGVESTVDGVDQTGLNGTPFERRRFSVPIFGTKKFIRLRATFTE